MTLQRDKIETKHNTAKTGEQVANNEHDNSNEDLLIASGVPQPSEAKKQCDNPSSEPTNWRENVKLGIEVVGLFAIVIYTIFSVLQWAQIRWTNKLTSESLKGNAASLQATLEKMQAQTDATKNLYVEAQKQTEQSGKMVSSSAAQAKSARDAVETARRSLLLTAHSERAWIGLANATLVLFAPNNPVRFEIELTNSGKTPALNVRSATLPVWLNSTRTDASKLRELEIARHSFQFVPVESITPGQISILSVGSSDGGVTAIGVNAVLTGKQSIYFPGRIEFVDIYQRPQWVEYCMYITGIAGKAVILSCPLQQSHMSYQKENY